MDANILFFEWLLSDECAWHLIDRTGRLPLTWSQRDGYEAVLRRSADFRRDIFALREIKGSMREVSAEEVVKKHYIATKALEVYLEVVSKISGEFAVYPYDFRIDGGNLDIAALEAMLNDPPEILSEYASRIIDGHILPRDPKVIGLSCMGQEQLYFVLLFGRMLKERSNRPIIVGGTFLNRIYEQGSLSQEWFGKYFDIIVKNEGEIPCQGILTNLREGAPLTKEVPGIIFTEYGKVVSAPEARPLNPAEIPFPDFDDMPIERYLSASTTLPVLASRGCYWGKCEFCRHGMVYGEKSYKTYEIDNVYHTVKHLSQKYGVTQFSFRDEALPPSIIRQLGEVFPPHSETGWTFSGDIRFEKTITADDYTNLYRIGFRNLQVGLESGSERVLKLMNKGDDSFRTLAMVRNLTAATDAGIWIHCFLFFGFPGETDEDAEMTYEFVLNNADIIGNFGCGTFVLEHNSPIYRHLDEFGVRITDRPAGRMNVFYEHEVAEGNSVGKSLEWMDRLVSASNKIPKFHAVSWIPREQYICILSKMGPKRLVEEGQSIRDFRNLPRNASLSEVASLLPHPSEEGTVIMINRTSHRIQNLKGNASELMLLFHENGFGLKEMHEHCPSCTEWL